MKIAILGRTAWLLDAARRLRDSGHSIVLVATAEPAEYYSASSDDFAGLSKDCGCPFISNASNLGSALAASGADIAVSVNWPSVLGEDIVNALKYGVLNAHAGDLPRYRGNACPNWAILNGESHVGLCVHLMEPASLDSGPVLVRRHFPLDDRTYIEDIYHWLDEALPHALTEAVQGLVSGALTMQPQSTNPADWLRCYPRRAEDGRINWSWDADRIHRLVRASSHPFAGAFGYLDDGRKLTVWRAEKVTHPGAFCAVPGQILFRADRDVVVACGSGVLRLTEVELEGECTHTASATVLARSLRARLS